MFYLHHGCFAGGYIIVNYGVLVAMVLVAAISLYVTRGKSFPCAFKIMVLLSATFSVYFIFRALQTIYT